MRYAILSDIHGNLPAWNTVLSDLAVHKVDCILCLGDIVGYGPQPAECLKSVYSHATAMVLGNHDAVVGGRMSAESFNDRAGRIISWTQTRLGDKARSLFAQMPLVLKGKNFRCVHGDFADPAVFNYVASAEDAAASFAACSEQLLFCGHTHRAALYIVGNSGRVHDVEPQDFSLEEGKRYLVNVGSVGSPRDGDPRASYVIFDEERGDVFFKRVPFDFEAFRAAVEAAEGLRPEDVQLLRTEAFQAGTLTVREEADFEPNDAARAQVSPAGLEADLSTLKRSNRLLLNTTVISILGCCVLIAVFFHVVRLLLPHDASYPAFDAPAIDSVPVLSADGNLLPEIKPVRSSEKMVAAYPYRIFLDDDRKQTVRIDSDGHLVLGSSDASLEFRLVTPCITAIRGKKLEGMCRARFSNDFEGTFSLNGIQLQDEQTHTEKALFVKNFSDQNIPRDKMPYVLRAFSSRDDWRLARGTSDSAIGPKSRGVYLELRGNFSGTVTIGGISARGTGGSRTR